MALGFEGLSSAIITMTEKLGFEYITLKNRREEARKTLLPVRNEFANHRKLGVRSLQLLTYVQQTPTAHSSLTAISHRKRRKSREGKQR